MRSTWQATGSLQPSSSRGTSGADCVEIVVAPGTIHARDSKPCSPPARVSLLPGNSDPRAANAQLGMPSGERQRHPDRCQCTPRANCSRSSPSWSRSVRPSGRVSSTCTPS
nr:DUF397 domain-containing protein [Streptomyces sp. yr375]